MQGIVLEIPELLSACSSKFAAQKNAGLKVVTLIATLNPVSQVLW